MSAGIDLPRTGKRPNQGAALFRQGRHSSRQCSHQMLFFEPETRRKLRDTASRSSVFEFLPHWFQLVSNLGAARPLFAHVRFPISGLLSSSIAHQKFRSDCVCVASDEACDGERGTKGSRDQRPEPSYETPKHFSVT